MRQVNFDELRWLMFMGLKDLPKPIIKQLLGPTSTDREHARYIVSGMLVEKLKRLEILSSAPEPPPFRWANFEGGSGTPTIE